MKTTELEKDNNSVLQTIALIIYVLAFVSIIFINSRIQGNISVAPHGPGADAAQAADAAKKVASGSAATGTLAQIQVLLSTFVVLAVPKKGFIAAILLNATNASIVIYKVIVRDIIQSLPGAIVPISTIILISIIFIFSNRIIQKNSEISRNYKQLVETNRIIKEKDEKLSYLAYYDILTGLPNRQLFIEKLDETILNTANAPFTVLLADLDDFKQVNDVYGNNSGDIMLCTYSEKLKAFCGNNIFLARLGGDEFGFIIKGNMTEATILNYVEKIQSMISEPIQINDALLHSNISFGIASYPTNAVNSSDILKCVDNAIYFAKSNGKNRPCFYSQQ